MIGVKRDIYKWADWLAKNAREGVVIENKILEWKLAEQRESETDRSGFTPKAS